MSIDKGKIGKLIGITVAVMGAAFVSLSLIAKNKKANYVYGDEPEEKKSVRR